VQSFTDNEDRTWPVTLTIGSAKRVRGLLGLNLLEPCEPDTTAEGEGLPVLTRLGTDVMLLCDVIFALVKPQADQQGVTDEQWAEAMGGDAILAAQQAFYEELVDFFHRQGRQDVEKAVRTQQRMIELVIEAGVQKIGQIEPEKEVAGIFAQAESGGSPTNSAPSPD